jgi:hypothetical protein
MSEKKKEFEKKKEVVITIPTVLSEGLQSIHDSKELADVIFVVADENKKETKVSDFGMGLEMLERDVFLVLALCTASPHLFIVIS